jgi:hypothetical protein
MTYSACILSENLVLELKLLSWNIIEPACVNAPQNSLPSLLRFVNVAPSVDLSLLLLIKPKCFSADEV